MKKKRCQSILALAVSLCVLITTLGIITPVSAAVTANQTKTYTFDAEKGFGSGVTLKSPTEEVTEDDMVYKIPYMSETNDGSTMGTGFLNHYVTWKFDVYFDAFNPSASQTYWRMVQGTELRGTEGSYTTGSNWVQLGSVSKALAANPDKAELLDPYARSTGFYFDKQQWYTLQYVIDTAEEKVRAYVAKRGESFNPVSFETGFSVADWAYADQYNARFNGGRGYEKINLIADSAGNKVGYENGNYAYYCSNIQFARDVGTAGADLASKGSNDTYIDNLSYEAYDFLYESVNKAQSTEEVKEALDFYAASGGFSYGTNYKTVQDMNMVYGALIGKSFTSDAEVKTAYDAAVTEYAVALYTVINAATNADEICTALNLYSEYGSFILAADVRLSFVTDINAVYSALLNKNFSSDEEVQSYYDKIVDSYNKNCILQSYGQYDFENTVNPFNVGSITKDSTDTAYGYTDRSGNQVFQAKSGSRNVLTLTEPVTSGLVVIEAQIFSDYYNGNTDPEYQTVNADGQTVTDPRGTSKIGGMSFNVSDSDNTLIKVAGITRSGNIAGASGGWGSSIFQKHKWYNVKYIIDFDAKTLIGKYGLVGEPMEDLVFQECYNITADTTGVRYTTEYSYDGVISGNNKNGLLSSNIKNFVVSDVNSSLDNWIDNLSVSVYQPVYKMINQAQNTTDVRNYLATYAKIGNIDTSLIGTMDPQPLLTAIYNHEPFTSTAELQQMIEEYMEPYSTTELTTDYPVDNRLICGYGDATAAEILSAVQIPVGASKAIYQADGSAMEDLNAKISEGMTIRVTAANGLSYTDYELGYAKYAEFEPLTAFAKDGEGKDCYSASFTIKSYVSDAKQYSVLVAEYDGDKMIAAGLGSIAPNAPGTYTAIASLQTKTAENPVYKAFVFSDGVIKPVKKPVTIEKNLSGAKVLCLGDSITGNYEPGYPMYIANLLGTTCYNGGVGGTTISLGSSGLNRYLSMVNIADALCDESYDWSETDEWVNAGGISGTSLTHYTNTLKTANIMEMDYLTMLFGTNDFSGAKALDNAENPKDTATIKGSARYIFEKLAAKNPNLKIVVAAPFYRDRQSKASDGTEDEKNSEDYPNSAGIYLRRYSQAICEVCAEYNIPVYNLYDLSGINRYNEAYYLSDGLHPTSPTGLQYLGQTFAQMLIGTYGK